MFTHFSTAVHISVSVNQLCQDAVRFRQTVQATTPIQMSVESFPKFTPPAAKLWSTIPAGTRKALLSNVWCGRCRHEVTIKNFSGAVKSNDLLVVGLCSECQGDVARLIEVR